MNLSVQVEKKSNILRKLTVKVAAKTVDSHLEKGLVEVQRTAKLKGFRPGHVPLSVVKQYYGEDVKHRVFHSLIDESFQVALKEQKLQAVGRPQIETPDHKTGEGAHDHAIEEGKDLTYIATVEVLPEIEVKGYTGIALKKESVEITDKDVDVVLKNLTDSQSELIPVTGGLIGADGTSSSRPAKKGDFVDMNFSGGIVTENGLEEKAGMKGNRVFEIGSDSLIPGFEDNLVDMRKGETKTFKVPFPKDFYDAEMAGKDAEFTVTVNEIKEKKLPELTDEFAKQMGYEGLDGMRQKARDHLEKERVQEVDRKLRSDLFQVLIEKNAFDVPASLIEAQARALAQDVAQNIKSQGADEATIRELVTAEMENIKKRAEGQVRASLIIEAIAKKEGIDVSAEEIDAEIPKIAINMKVDEVKLRDYYEKNPGRREDLEFRLREDRTVKFLLEKAKIKS